MIRGTRLLNGSRNGSNSKLVDRIGQMSYNGSMIKTLRKKLKLTQEQLADELGINARTIRRIEAGGKPKPLIEGILKTWAKEASWQIARMADKDLR